MHNIKDVIDKLKNLYKDIYELLGKPKNKTELIEGIKAYLKTYYNNDNFIFLIKLSNVGINYNYIHRSVDDLEIIKLYDEAISKINLDNPSIKSVNSILLDRINKLNNKDDIVTLLSSCEFDSTSFSYLYNQGIKLYVSVVSQQYGDSKLEQELKDKLDYYWQKEFEKKQDIIRKTKYEEALEYLYDAHLMIIEFISGEYISKEEYCNIHDINTKYFDYIIKIIKDFLPNDYKLYDEYLQKSRAIRYAKLKAFINKILECIKNGVKLEDGSTRPINPLDYYLMGGTNYKNRENDVLDAASKIMSPTDYNYFYKFIKKLTIKKDWNTQSFLYDVTYTYIINEETKVLSKGEKDRIISFLKENNIPINNMTCTYAIRQYIEGSIEIKIPEKSI